MVPDPRWFQCGSRSFFYLKADSDPGQPSQKVAFFNMLSIHQKDSKIKTSLFWKTGNIGQFPCSWIRTQIPNKDSGPWEPSQSGSGSTTLVTCTKIGSKRPVLKILFLTNSADPDQRQWLQAVLGIRNGISYSSVEIKVSLLFLLDDDRIQIRIRTCA
jgi:hypothetical protein